MQKNKTVGYLLAFFLGAFGLHAFYYRKYARGIIYVLITLVTQIPIMMFVGWIDMFFIRKWDENLSRSVKELPKKEKRGNREPSGIKKNIREETTKPALLNEKVEVKSSSDSSFYNEKENILDKYAHIKTPEHILDGLQQYLSRGDISKSGISISIETPQTSFIEDSFEYSGVYSNEEVREIPFQEYWTTFRHLDERQLKWYFYWRTQVLNKTYLDTDLSYIILFVYELMNYSFNPNAAFNISMMDKLYEQYKARQPKIGNYLPQWTADMLYELDEPELAKAWDAPSEEIPHLYSALEEKYPLNGISMNTWNKYIQYGRKSAYFNENRAKVYNLFKKNIDSLEEYYDEKEEPLIDKWFKINEVREVRHPFRSAVMGRSHHSVHVPMTYCLATDSLKKQTTALMKYSENISRELSGIAYRVKVDEAALPEALRERIRRSYFGEPADPKESESVKESVDSQERFKVVQDVKVEEEAEGSIPRAPIEQAYEETELDIKTYFDTSRIDALAEQADDLVSVFDSDNNDYETEKDKQKTESASDFDTLFMEDDVEEEDYAGLIDALSEQEKQFILLFSKSVDYMIDSVSAADFAKQSGEMIGVFLSELNQKANGYFGDILIEASNDSYRLSEEFVTVLENLEEGAGNENKET